MPTVQTVTTKIRAKRTRRKASVSTSCERVVRCCTPSLRFGPVPRPVVEAWTTAVRGALRGSHQYVLSRQRQIERPSDAVPAARRADLRRSVLPCAQLERGRLAPYSTGIRTASRCRGEAYLRLATRRRPVASTTTVPSSSGEQRRPPSRQPSASPQDRRRPFRQSILTANDPLAGPPPASAGSWPASFGNDAGSSSRIGPKPSTSWSCGWSGPMPMLRNGVGWPPGTGVRSGPWLQTRAIARASWRSPWGMPPGRRGVRSAGAPRWRRRRSRGCGPAAGRRWGGHRAIVARASFTTEQAGPRRAPARRRSCGRRTRSPGPAAGRHRSSRSAAARSSRAPRRRTVCGSADAGRLGRQHRREEDEDQDQRERDHDRRFGAVTARSGRA